MSAATPHATTVPGVDVERLAPWLSAQLPGLVPPFSFTRIGAGQSNLTYRLTDAEGASVVLRRPPLGEILASAHDMGREHTVLSALAGAGARVPRPLAFCDDVAVIGAPFYVMEHVDGLVLSSVETAERLDPVARTSTAEGMAGTLARLHALDVDAIGLGSLRRPDSLGARQLRRWTKQWHASKTRELRDVDEVGELLAKRLPEEREQCLVHGDYHLGNALVSPGGEIQAILDWELCTVGDPLADVGLMVAYWGENAAAAHESDVLFPEPVTALPGFPDAHALAATYLRAAGRDASELGYWVAFAYWKVAIIVEGVYRRWLNDPTNGTDAGRLGAAVPRLARLAAEAASSSSTWNDIGSSRSGR